MTGRVVFLDVDLLIMRNIDALLNAIPEPLGRSRWNVVDGSPGVAAVTCKSRWGARFFNSGVMVFTPSLTALRALLELTRFATGPWYGSVPHAGERWPDVCSPREEPWAYKRILPNTSFSECRSHVSHGRGHPPDPISKACQPKLTEQSILNVLYHQHSLLPEGFNVPSREAVLSDPSHRIIHFLGEPKPWESTSTSGGQADAAMLWRRRCLQCISLDGTHTAAPLLHRCDG